MTWQFDVNNSVIYTIPNTDPIGSSWLGLINLLVAQGAASIVGSGDGVSTFENDGQTAGPYNVLSGGVTYYPEQSLSNTFSATGSWVRWRITGKTLEFCLKRSTVVSNSSADDIVLKCSPTGFTSNDADANNPPTATDQIYLIGSGESTTSAWGVYTADIYWHAACEDTAQDGFYPHYLFTTTQGGQLIYGTFLFDVIDQKVGSDSQPWIILNTGGTFGWTFDELDNSVHMYRDFGGAQEAYFNNGHAYGIKCADNGLLFPSNVPAQAADGFARDFPLIYGRDENSFFKGISRNFRWKGTSGRQYPDTESLSTTGARIYVDDILLPWKQSETPL